MAEHRLHRVRLGLDLKVLLVRDGAYEMIRWKQAEMGLADEGMTFQNPDFVRLAESFGARDHRPTSADDFAAVLSRCLATPGVHLIDVPIDSSDDARAIGEEIALFSQAL